MDQETVLQHFRDAGALLEGHFVLSSGKHSSRYLQCARVMMDAERAAVLCAALADNVRATVGGGFDWVISPAMGGVIVGYEMGRQLGVPSMFVERVEGEFTLRRGFGFEAEDRILVVEDIVTTGLSSRECIDTLKALGGNVVAEACLIDRSGGAAEIGVPLVSLARLDLPTYDPDDLPPQLASLPAEKPGSRGLT
ncbi:MAG: orotate phosphoribosyltransferase [Alphaproteobacteria bacterium]